MAGLQSKYYRNDLKSWSRLPSPPPPPLIPPPPPPPQPVVIEDPYHERPFQRPYDVETAGVSLPKKVMEQFLQSPQEPLYKEKPIPPSPPSPPPINWKASVGNPTPIALVGIVVSLTPLSCDLMGLLGAGGNGAAGIASYYFFGGLLLVITSLLEWGLGNTFPSVVFASYGAFFLSFAGTLTPSFGAFAAYSPDPTNPSAGLTTPAFNASFGWFLVWMGVLSLLFFLCSLRTNVVFVVIFACLVGVFGALSAAFFLLAAGNTAAAGTFVIAGGVSAFIASLAGWYILLSIMLTTVDFPLSIPVGDLSGWIQPASAREKEFV